LAGFGVGFRLGPPSRFLDSTSQRSVDSTPYYQYLPPLSIFFLHREQPTAIR
jgi:hypothetical protein